MIKRWATWAVKITLTLGALWYLQQKVDLVAAWRVAKGVAPIAILMALLLQVVQVAICAGRWKLVLTAIGSGLPFWKACELFLIGNFFGQVLPGAVGGDAVRMWKTRRAGLSLSASVNSVMLERVATVLGLVLLVTATQPFLVDKLSDKSGVWVFPALTVGGIGGIILLTLLDQFPPSVYRWSLLRVLAKLAGDTRRLFLHPRNALSTMVVVIVGHINLALVVWVLALGLKAQVTVLDCLVLVPPVILVATLPISIAGWGAREVAMVTMFGFIGVPAAQTTVVSVLFGLVSVLITLPGGAFWLFSKDRAALAIVPAEGDVEA